MIVIAIVGIPLFGTITMPMLTLLKLIGCIFVTIIAYSSIFTFIAMMISNKTITAIVSIMLVLGLMIFSVTSLNILSAQEYIQSGSLVDGEMQFQKERNPRYPSEDERKVHQILIDINPAGQMFQIAGRVAPNLKVLPLYSLGIIVIFTGAGLVLFKKKELK